MSEEKKMIEPTQVHVSVKRPRRFKAGAELSGSVNLVDVEIIEEIDEQTSRFGINLMLETTFTQVSTCED